MVEDNLEQETYRWVGNSVTKRTVPSGTKVPARR